MYLHGKVAFCRIWELAFCRIIVVGGCTRTNGKIDEGKKFIGKMALEQKNMVKVAFCQIAKIREMD